MNREPVGTRLGARRAVDLIGAGFRDNRDLRSRGASELRRIRRRLDSELSDGVKQADKLTGGSAGGGDTAKCLSVTVLHGQLWVIGLAKVGIEQLLSAGLLAAGHGLDGDKYGADLLHKLRVLHFQQPTPLCLGIHAQEA
jgi:hypothetical protein